jgi:hypothetical protein
MKGEKSIILNWINELNLFSVRDQPKNTPRPDKATEGDGVVGPNPLI